MTRRLSLLLLLALVAILLVMLACEDTGSISGPANYNGRGYDCPAGQHFSSTDAGNQICRAN
jgi:hypothetical protein